MRCERKKDDSKWKAGTFSISRVQRANHAVFALCRGEKTRVAKKPTFPLSVTLIPLVFFLALAKPAIAQTGCDAVALPLTEDFDSCGSGVGTLPRCWYATRNYDSGQLPHVDTAQRSSGTASLVMYPGTLTGSHYSMVIAPQLDVDSLDGAVLSFRLFATSTATRVEVGICVDTLRQSRAFQPLDTLHVDQTLRWQDFEVDLGRYSGQGRRVAFRLQRSLQADASPCWIDDVAVEACGLRSLRAEHIGSTSLTLLFDSYGHDAMQVTYGDTTITGAHSPLPVSGLQPLTEYLFTVGCPDGIQHTLSVTTLDGAGMVPAYYEPMVTGVPSGWRFPAGGTPSAGGGRLHLTPTGDDSCVAVLPLQEAVPVSDLNVAMLLAGSGNTRLVVGVMEYADEPESFTPVDTLVCTAAEQQHLVSLAPYSGLGRYIAFVAAGSGTVTVGEVRVAQCMLSNLRLYNLTESEATLAWDTLTAGAGARLEYGQEGFERGQGTLVTPSDNPFTITGLDPATAYDLYLWPPCGDSVCQYDMLHATTFAHSVLPPYCTDFEEDDGLPQGWVGPATSYSAGSYSGAAALRMPAGSRVSLPLIGSAAPDTVLLEFYATGTSTLSIGTADNAFDVSQTQATINLGGWQRHSVVLTDVADHCIILEATGTATIDALTLHTATVATATVGNIGSSTATVRWHTVGSDSASVEYSLVASADADFDESSATATVAADSLILDSLQPGAYYAVHLRPVSDSAGCYPTVLHFRTLADSVHLPFCEDFEEVATASYPDLWRRRSALGEYPIVSTERNNTGSRSLHFAATATSHTTAILPDAAGCATHHTLAFWTNVTAAPVGAMLIVGTMRDIDDDASFLGTDTILFSATDVWQHHELGLVPAVGHLALRLVGGNGETHLFVDDLCLNACAARNVRLGSVQQDAATLSWTGDGVSAVVAHISGAISRSDTFYTSPAVITNLGVDATYRISIEALCDCGGSGVAYAQGGYSSGNDDNNNAVFVLNTLPSAIQWPVCNTFESLSTGRYPTGWRRSGSVAVSDRNYCNGGHSLAIDSGSMVILPRTLSDGPVVISFDVYSADAGMLADSALMVGIATNPDSAAHMTPLAALHLDVLGEWQHLSALLAGSIDSGSFVVLRSSADIFLDNLTAARCGIGDATVTDDGIVGWQQWFCTAVQIEYGPSGFTPGDGTDTVVSGSPFVIPDIDSRQSYDIHLSPLGTSSTCQDVRLTLGSSTSIPYCELFDMTPTGGMPQGWNIGRPYDGTPTISAAGDGSCLYMKATASARSIAVLPKLATSSLQGLQLSLSMTSTNSQRAMLLVGEIADAADPNTFRPVDTLQCTASNQWQTLRMPLSALDGEQRIALACEATAQTAELWVDSIAVTRGVTPTLTVVSARRVEVLSDTDGAGWLEYGAAGFEQGDGHVVEISGSPFYIDNLAPDSAYWFYSRADSDAVTCLAPLSVTMPTEVGLPYCGGRDTVEQLVLPEFSIDSLHNAHIYFDLYGSNSVAVGVMERRGEWSSFVGVDTVESPGRAHVALASYTGNGRFVAMTAVGGGNFVVDNIRVTGCELPVVTLEADGRVVVRGTGAVEYDARRVAVVDSVLLDDLADTTEYAFFPLCDTTSSACGAPVVIVTSMAVGVPYCADIYDALPPGWTVAEGTATVANGELALEAGATVLMPVLPTGTAVLEYEEKQDGAWLPVYQSVEGPTRPALTASTRRVLRNIAIEHCVLPRALSVSQIGDGTATFTWDSACDGFYLGYRLSDDTVLTVVSADSQPLVLTVESDTLYDIYLMCDTAAATCRQPMRLRTLASSVALPYCQDMAGASYDTLPSGWRRLDMDGYTCLILPQPYVDSIRHLNIVFTARTQGTEAPVVLGTMYDAASYTSFDSLVTFSVGNTETRCFYAFADYYGAGRFLALRVADADSVEIGRVVVGECAAYNVEIAEHEADHVVFEWQSQGEPTVAVSYGPQGCAADSVDTVLASVSPLRIDSLSPLTNYVFYVSHSCPAQDTLCLPIGAVDTFYTFTPQGVTGCVDYTDLTASYVSCNSGSYTNPSSHNGVIDHGYLDGASRHTVHYDTAERDPRTGGLLRTVPEGESSSVRLGNWLAGGGDNPQAESLTYALTVDSGDIDLLLLQYAAVLQDAEHAPSLQPRFRLEILNASGLLIDSCGMVDFVANANLGWNEADDDVLWKDWTTVGLDLTPYSGQTIFIRLTTYDCGEGSHYGYAYFTLRCAAKRMETEGCSNVPSNRFTVPSGFNYSWTINQGDSVVSTERSILVPSDNEVTYFCHLSSIDNPACGFDMSAFAGARYPLALFDTSLSVDACSLTLVLTDRSTISFDGTNAVGTGEPCETIRWLVDGDTSTAAVQTLTLSDTATISVTLIAGIASDRCLDTTTQQIHIAYPHPHAMLEGDTARCYDDDSTAVTIHFAASHSWADTVRMFAPASDTVVGVIVVDTNGCVDTLRHHLTVHPVFHLADTDTVCASALAYAWRDTTLAFTLADTSVAATLPRTSAYGCDSTMTLVLRLLPAYDVHHADTTCDNAPLAFFDTTLSVTGTYPHSDTTTAGCDSVVTMHLTVYPTYTHPDIRQACDSLRWLDGVLYLTDTVGPVDTLTTAYGCDSVLTLSLAVYPSYLDIQRDTFCEGTLYTFRSHSLGIGGYYADTLHSQHSCDSVMAIDLFERPLPQVSIRVEHDCTEGRYLLHADTDVPLVSWQWGWPMPSPHYISPDIVVVAQPRSAMQYLLQASYADEPRCTASDSIVLEPFVVPVAALRVSPQLLKPDNTHYDAYDTGRDYLYRRWYVDGERQAGDNRHIEGYADPDEDTLSIVLTVGTAHCADTASATIAIRHDALFVPNAFTPGEETNNRFAIVGNHIAHYEIHIYNRYGVLMFSSDDINNPWDGNNLAGSPCPTGNYVCYIRYSTVYQPQSVLTRTETVLLIR